MSRAVNTLGVSVFKRAALGLAVVVGLLACTEPATVDSTEPVDVATNTTAVVNTTITTVGTTTTIRVSEDPSQSPAAAEHDGVLPDLAALPLDLRSDVLVSAETSEGTWVLSRPSSELSASSWELGDTEGSYGVDWIDLAEYGEVLLLPEEDRIWRAYPMPAFPPDWLLVTDQVVYVGKIGDGGLPHSAIGRIDRSSLEALFMIFPVHEQGDDFWPQGWETTPKDAHLPIAWGIDTREGWVKPLASGDPDLLVDPVRIDDIFATVFPEVASSAEVAVVDAFIDFAQDPGDEIFARLPLANTVGLGLGSEILETVAAEDLRTPASWKLDVEHFRAYVGPFSPGQALAKMADDYAVRGGEHSHCASPPMPSPSGFEGHRRVSVQPGGMLDSCLMWHTVDFFINAGGLVEAITMDIWEP